MARNECLRLKINRVRTRLENLESCKSFQPNSISGNAIKPPHPRAHGAWYLVAGTLLVLRGLWESLARDAWFSVLGPLATGEKDLCGVLSCRHCESLLESGTRKQPLSTLFVYEVKRPWKGGKESPGPGG